MDKNYNLALFAIFKNEGHIIKEWIEHYLSEGVEHFWLIDNGSTDNYEYEIEPYMDKITLFKDPTRHAQSPLYNKYVLPELYQTEWVIGCDLDEFIWATKGTIKDTLKNIDSEVGVIHVPWEQYGSSGHVKQPEKVIPSFLHRKEGTFYVETKSIARSRVIQSLGVHTFDLKEDCKILDSSFKEWGNHPFLEISEELLKNAKIRLAHYQVQSRDWYTQVKMTRGDVAFPTSDNARDDSYFKERDTNDIYDDSLYQKTKNNFTSINKEWLLFLFLLSSLSLLFFFIVKKQNQS
jgi:hypothetical protein